MSKVRVAAFGVSIDGFGAGPDQSLQNPRYPTAVFQKMYGDGKGTTGVRGPWPDESWKGWRGDNPPYHVPVFVLTHHPRKSITLEVGTVFHFVTDGMHAALDRARQAAGGKDIRIGGGPATVRQYVDAGLVGELHLAISPVVLGAGEPLFAGMNLTGYACVEHAATENALHVVLQRP